LLLHAAAYALERAALALFWEMERDGVLDPGSKRIRLGCVIFDLMVKLGVPTDSVPEWIRHSTG
jgi:hypothetical protein